MSDETMPAVNGADDAVAVEAAGIDQAGDVSATDQADDVTDAGDVTDAAEDEAETGLDSDEDAGDDAEDDDAEDDDASAEGGEAKVSGRSKRDVSLANEGEIAADYIEGLLDIADLDGDIDTFNEGGRAHVSVITDSNVLVGKSGEVLEALQELARLAVMTETGHRSRLMLDIAGHRDKRRTELQALASEAVAQVGASGESVRLTPMNPFERKIVHDVIAAAGLVSESEGEEPHRRVVVMPKA